MNSLMKILQELCKWDFCIVISKGDFGEVRRWGDEEDIWTRLRKDLGGSFVKVLGGDEREAKLLNF
jgi:hypothetical protein